MGTIAHYTIEQVKETPVPLPEIAEQKTVGDFFIRIDDMISLCQKASAKWQQMKKALLQQMFV